MSKSNPRRHSRRLDGIPESKTGLLLQRATALRESGEPVIDLALGTPDYPPPAFLIEAGQRMLGAGKNGYIDSKGAPNLRQAVASQFSAEQSLAVDPDREVTISAGASAALNATILALLDPGDETIVLEPYYEYFVPQLVVAGAIPRFAKLSYGDWRIERKELKKAVSKRCRAILLNSPHNPTGRVFSLEELQLVADLCHKHDLIAVCDEAYAPFVYESPYKSLCSLPGMKERCVVIRSISKVFNVSGWRVGSIIAPADLSAAIRRVNTLSLGAPAPLQEACAVAYEQYAGFTAATVAEHKLLRDKLETALAAKGFALNRAEGTFSLFAGSRPLGFMNSDDCCQHLLAKNKILAVSGNTFFRSGLTSSYVRFCFARSAVTIDKAVAALAPSLQSIPF